MTAEPLHKRKLSEQLCEQLLARIRGGEFAPGDALPSERELMEHYGVGRPAVREALQSLERSNIVEIAQGERARVAVPTAQDLIAQLAGGARHLLRIQPGTLAHLKDARIFLETGMARLAAQQAGEADVARLRRRLEEHRAAMDDLQHFLARDMAFHREIAAISGNPIYPAIVEALFGWAGEYYQKLVRAPGAERLTLAEHERIVDAIAARDPQAAEDAMREHLTRANQLYRQLAPGSTDPG
ncbi:transcriptional regulator NanR [Caldimonas tepidiphila]|uniref:transcriptional regulator NanR n=1 Tax=Caldimonas tepidiphila TaxID=2315841 RepID=UPI000E5B8F78|nr:transcriptional regulator NanR [Caldimonas tepidiphila]